MERICEFYQTPSRQWYVDLPEWPGDKGELEMVIGADEMLTMIAAGEERIKLKISDVEFPGADVLNFERPEEEFGGGYYSLNSFEGKAYTTEKYGNHMWLCGVTLFVFNGVLPKQIYLQRA